MGKSGQAFVAATEGTSFTMYAMMKAMGIPLSKEQEEFQAYLERTYPPIVEPSPDRDEDEPEDHTLEDAEHDWKRDKEV